MLLFNWWLCLWLWLWLCVSEWVSIEEIIEWICGFSGRSILIEYLRIGGSLFRLKSTYSYIICFEWEFRKICWFFRFWWLDRLETCINFLCLFILIIWCTSTTITIPFEIAEASVESVRIYFFFLLSLIRLTFNGEGRKKESV